MPAEQKETVTKQIEEFKTLLKEEKWDELKTRLDAFDQAAQQFNQGQGNPQEPKGE
jgi:molecular chaperone DnaK